MKLDLRGAVIIIGSLYWDDSKIRKGWRDKFLRMKQGKKIDLPIRYGRQSSTWHNTYTMVLSVKCPKLGRGYAVPFNKPTKTLKDLKKQALSIASAERNKKNVATFDWCWGSLGILLNPALKSRNFDPKPLLNSWAAWYSSDFSHARYRLGKTEKPSIEKTGILSVEWPKNMKFDFLIATVIKPKNNKRYPSAQEIANAMHRASCYNYFVQNRQKGIETFQDKKILKFLKTKYNLTSYLRKNGIT